MKTRPFETFDLYSAPGHLLRRCHQRSHELYNEATAEFGLTRQQLALMVALHKKPGSSIQDLADLIGTDRNTLGSMINRLLKKQLIVRRRSPDDSRAYQIDVNEAGVELLRQLEPAIREVGDQILAPLTANETAEFLRLARKLVGLKQDDML